MRTLALIALIAAVAALGGSAAGAGKGFPERIDLPDGFAPEGIALGRGDTFFVGSIPTGAIYRGSLRTGEGAVLAPGAPGRQSIGLSVDARNRVFAAGGSTGRAYVYDGDSGALLAEYELTAGPTFVNDVVVTGDGAYFTDSVQPFVYRVPIGPGGALGSASEAIPLSGDVVYQPGFNVNGIDATPNGKRLVIVQSNTGQVFTVDPGSGVASEIDLGGETVTFGDGILLEGKTLYVVRNFENRVAVVRIYGQFRKGEIVRHLTDDALDIPTTIAKFGRRLFVVNARFTTPATPETPYWLTQLRG